MATHDYIIDNQSAPAFRSDLNGALQAIVTQNSSATAPTTTYANMIWYDTATNQLKKRGEANVSWIVLGFVNEAAGTFIPSGASEVGAVTFFASSTAPSGWLKANGALVSRTTYSTLFTAIGTTFGVGDGSTTFALPDLRGEFLRGWSDGRAVDSGRAFGSLQAQAIESHTHTTTEGNASTGVFSGPNYAMLSVASANTRQVNAAGGTETRPRNVALLACIKF